ncbi:MAG: hypothetical protein J5718_03025, partial [Lachnospiraceae bacterium]|nr:hypothetical protein [Lachnospiraceae bacterium]
MKKYYRLVAGAVLALIAIIWICFLVLHEPDDSASKEIRDAMTAQLNETKEKIENSATKVVEQVTPTPTAEPTPTEEPTPTDEALTPTPTPLV